MADNIPGMIAIWDWEYVEYYDEVWSVVMVVGVNWWAHSMVRCKMRLGGDK